MAHGNGSGQATPSGQSRRTPVLSTQRPPTNPKAASEMPLPFGGPTQANLAHKMAEPNKPRPAKTCGMGWHSLVRQVGLKPPAALRRWNADNSDWARHDQQVTTM